MYHLIDKGTPLSGGRSWCGRTIAPDWPVVTARTSPGVYVRVRVESTTDDPRSICRNCLARTAERLNCTPDAVLWWRIAGGQWVMSNGADESWGHGVEVLHQSDAAKVTERGMPSLIRRALDRGCIVGIGGLRPAWSMRIWEHDDGRYSFRLWRGGRDAVIHAPDVVVETYPGTVLTVRPPIETEYPGEAVRALYDADGPQKFAEALAEIVTLKFVVVEGSDENPVSSLYATLDEAKDARDSRPAWSGFSIVSVRFEADGSGTYTGQAWPPGHDTPLGPTNPYAIIK